VIVRFVDISGIVDHHTPLFKCYFHKDKYKKDPLNCWKKPGIKDTLHHTHQIYNW